MHRWLGALVLVCCGAPGAFGFGLFGLDSGLRQFALQPQELARLKITGGWVEGAPDRLVFEVHNDLSRPVSCSGVHLELKGRESGLRALEPVIHIPPAQSRRAAVSGVRKAELRQYTLVCTCLRRQESGPCQRPFED